MKKVKEFVKAAAKRAPVRPPSAAYIRQKAKGVKEMEMFNQWHAGGRKKSDPLRHELLGSMENLVQREAKKAISGTGGTIPIGAVEGRLRVYASKALDGYDPTRGTKLTTHVHNQFRAVTDDVAKWRNVQKMPKARMQQVQSFTNAKEELEEVLGRPPTVPELQVQLPHLKRNDVALLHKEIRTENFSDMVSEHQPDSPRTSAWELRQKFTLRKAKMTAEVKAFGDKFLPRPGTAQPSIKQIAKELRITEARAYKIKTKLELVLAKR
jgi:DNA-directed RNA polymerase specialized sigma subunit